MDIFNYMDLSYKIIDDNNVKLIGPFDYSVNSIIIPKKVDDNGINYNITSINCNSFKSNITITDISFELPSNILSFEKLSFFSSFLTNITIPNSVLSIDEYSFSSNLKLTSLLFEPNSKLHTIGNYAFDNCNLSSITIPNSVKILGIKAFGSNKNLTSLSIEPNSILCKIHSNAFINCNNIQNDVIIPETVQLIGDGAFFNTSIKKFIFLTCNDIEFGNYVFNIRNNPIAYYNTSASKIFINKLSTLFNTILPLPQLIPIENPIETPIETPIEKVIQIKKIINNIKIKKINILIQKLSQLKNNVKLNKKKHFLNSLKFSHY
jgi:hypothetical protein